MIKASRIETASQLITPVINGASCDSHSPSEVQIVNPSNGHELFRIPVGCESDVDRAVGAARGAFEDGRWRDAPPSHQKRVLHRFAELIEENADTLDALDAEEMGKPISVKLGGAGAAAGLMHYYAEAMDKVAGQVFTSDKGSVVLQRTAPRGVVGAIVPWNFPTYISALKVAPALAAGNSVVLKPSELASRSSVQLVLLALQAGLPEGVLNIVLGQGETSGRALGLHCDVDMLTFTGSTNVGKLILQYSGQSNMKVVMAECGGKSPHIVFADGVDIEAASKRIARSILTNQGQICSAGTRLLVHRSIEQDLIKRIVSHCREIVMGDAMNPTSTFGPLASVSQCERVMGYIQSATTDGAELVYGGRRSLVETGGYFVEPTLFRNVSPTSRLAQDEVFGPVLSVMTFDSEDEAISVANGTSYGFAAYVWTADMSTGMRVAKRLRSMVDVNAVAPTGEGAGYSASAELARESGLGLEGGLAGLESYLYRQQISIYHG